MYVDHILLILLVQSIEETTLKYIHALIPPNTSLRSLSLCLCLLLSHVLVELREKFLHDNCVEHLFDLLHLLAALVEP
jgi:hypothetical protein